MRQYKVFARILVFVFFISSAFFIDSFSEFSACCESIREKVLRLHIIAHSDADYDQAIKLKIRDRILSESKDLFYNGEDILTAKEKATESLGKIKAIANDELLKNGLEADAEVYYTNMFFDTRAYGDFTLPAGHYDAVRVVIGEGKGKNWWCVLYPGLCIPAATENPDTFTSDETKIVESSPRYEVKFILLEFFEKFKKN